MKLNNPAKQRKFAHLAKLSDGELRNLHAAIKPDKAGAVIRRAITRELLTRANPEHYSGKVQVANYPFGTLTTDIQAALQQFHRQEKLCKQ